MYYNNKFRILNTLLSVAVVWIVVIGMENSNLITIMPIALIVLGLQQILWGVNYLKLEKTGYMVQIGVGIFLFICSISSMVLQNL